MHGLIVCGSFGVEIVGFTGSSYSVTKGYFLRGSTLYCGFIIDVTSSELPLNTKEEKQIE